MISLSLSTSSSHLSFSLKKDQEIKSRVLKSNTSPKGENVSISIDQLLKDNQVERHELDQIIVDNGPGSFTGIRCAIAHVQAIGFVHQIPLIGVSSLDLIAENYRSNHSGESHQFISVIGAGRKEYYCAFYELSDNQLKKTKKDHILKWDELEKYSLNHKLIGYQCPERLDCEIFPESSHAFLFIQNHKEELCFQQKKCEPNYIRLSEPEEKIKEGKKE